MPSTYSALKFELMATGENNTTWGDKTNVNLNAVEQAISGTTDITFASADITLTLADTSALQPARAMRLNLIGVSGGARTLTVPAIPKVYFIRNGCADPITIKTAAGVGAVIPANKFAIINCDGTDSGVSVNYAQTMHIGTGSPGTALANGGLVVSGVAQFNGNVRINGADGSTLFAVLGASKAVRIVPLATYTLIQGTDTGLNTGAPLIIDGSTLQLNASAAAEGININAAGDTTLQGASVMVGALTAQSQVFVIPGVQGACGLAFTTAPNYGLVLAGGNTIQIMCGAAVMSIQTGNVTLSAGTTFNTSGSIFISNPGSGLSVSNGPVSIAGANAAFSCSGNGTFGGTLGVTGFATFNGGANFTAGGPVTFSSVSTAWPKIGSSEIGLKDVQPVTGGNGNYTFALVDRGGQKVVSGGSVATNIFTIPPSSSVSWPPGSKLRVSCYPTGCTLRCGAGVAFVFAGAANSVDRTVANNGWAELIQAATDLWFISGSGVT